MFNYYDKEILFLLTEHAEACRKNVQRNFAKEHLYEPALFYLQYDNSESSKELAKVLLTKAAQWGYDEANDLINYLEV